jgi:hypothetical protein
MDGSLSTPLFLGLAYYFRIAANLGDGDAQNEMGHCYQRGDGVNKDMRLAAAYYRLAEQQGSGMFGNSWIWKEKYDDFFKERFPRFARIAVKEVTKTKKEVVTIPAVSTVPARANVLENIPDVPLIAPKDSQDSDRGDGNGDGDRHGPSDGAGRRFSSRPTELFTEHGDPQSTGLHRNVSSASQATLIGTLHGVEFGRQLRRTSQHSSLYHPMSVHAGSRIPADQTPALNNLDS